MLAIYMVLLAVAVCMLVELLAFHVVLISKEMTTYDFIIAQREQLAAGVPGAPIGGISTATSLSRLLVNLIRCGPCCASTKVQPEALATVSPPKKVHVSLNPCAACHTQKPEGNPHAWAQTGRPAAVSAVRPGDSKQGDSAAKVDLVAQVGPADGPSFASPAGGSDGDDGTRIKAFQMSSSPGPVPEGMSTLAWLPHAQCQHVHDDRQQVRMAPHLDEATTAAAMAGALQLPAAYSLPRGTGHQAATVLQAPVNGSTVTARPASRQHWAAAGGSHIAAGHQQPLYAQMDHPDAAANFGGPRTHDSWHRVPHPPHHLQGPAPTGSSLLYPSWQ
jgi:hypothetical protein